MFFCLVIPVAIKYNPILKSTVKMLIFMLLFKIIITVLLNKEHFLSEFSMVNLKLIVKSHYLYYCHIMHHAFIIKLFWWSGIKGCVSLNPSKISKSGWWGLQLDAWQLCNSLWYGLINSKLHINKKIFFLYHTTSDGVIVQCFKSPSWPLRNGLDLWPQLIYTLSWESQHKEI